MMSMPHRTDTNPAATACAFAAFFSCANIAVLLGTVIAVSILVVSIILLPVSAVSAALILAVILAGNPPGHKIRYRS